MSVARTLADVERLRPAWQRLQHHPNADLDFTLTLLAARAGTAAPCVLALGDPADPRAILVARRQQTRLPVRFGYRVLCRPRATAIEVVQGGPLGDLDAAGAEALTAALLGLLRDGTAEVLRFEHLPTDGALAQAAAALPGCLRSGPVAPHWRTAIPDSYDAFLKGRSSNTRRNLRRYPDRFLELHGSHHEVKVYREPGDLDRILAELEQVAATTYQRGLGAGFQADAERRALLALSLERGWYRAWVLHVAGRPAAFWDGRLYRGTFFTDTTGYLPELEDARPGWFLLMRMIQDLCADPAVHGLDFGVGDAQYKRMLCDRSVDEAPLEVFAPRGRGRRLRLLLGGVGRLENVARAVLAKTGLTQRVKQIWRRRLRGGDDRPPAPPAE